MSEDTHNKLNQIKRSFRLMMNGVTAQSMRSKGLDYKLNWGTNIIDLKTMAQEYGKDYDLAVALWKESIRECKILATLIMPANQMHEELACTWMDQAQTQEMAEMLALNLFQYLSYASKLAYRWLASDKALYQICAFQILSKCFIKGEKPDDKDISVFLSQACVALQDENLSVRHAAMNCVIHFMDLGKEYDLSAREALSKARIDII